MRAQIIGTGSYLPKKMLTNDDLSTTLDTSDEWIRSRTGIKTRFCADLAAGETCSFMAMSAAKNALAMAKMQASELDLIIVATVTPDKRLPSMACIIQDAIGAYNAAAFDLVAACAGSVYGLSVANSFIRSGSYQKILFIAAETMSSAINWQDRNTAVLFGDGASAAVIAADKNSAGGFIDFDLYADGRLKDIIYVEAGGSQYPIDEDAIQNKKDKMTMNGRETYKFAVRATTEAVETILKDNNIPPKNISYIVPHQANLRIIEGIAKRLNVGLDRFLINLDRCANTSAASLLLAYDEANRSHKIKTGDLILMLAFGAGFAWGACLYQA